MTSEGGARSGRARAALVALAAVGLALAAYRGLLGLELLGFDSYPLIASARVRGVGDLVGLLTEELMDGRYPDGRFYRPLTSASFALDHALFGLDPRGYHATDLALLVANALLLAALGARLLGLRLLGLLVAVGVFVLHPLQLELLPVPPRRGDALCLALVVSTLLALPRGRRDGEAWRPWCGRAWAAALLALLAASAKETGVVVWPLAFACAALRPGAALGPKAALRASLPALAGVALFVVARTAVLNGLGGHAESALGGLLEWPRLLGGYLALLLAPQERAPSALQLWPPGLLLLVLAVLAARAGGERGRFARGAAFLVVWFGLLVAVHSLSGRVEPWYGAVFVAPYALLLGALAQRGRELWPRGRRTLAAALALAALGLAAGHVRHSALVVGYPGWERADRLEREYLARFEQAVRATPTGETATLPYPPGFLRADADGPTLRGVALLGPYSLPAWAELHLPERPVVVLALPAGRTPPPSSRPDAVRVVLALPAARPR